MYDYYMDYVFNGKDEYPVYYVFKVTGYKCGASYGPVVARALTKEQAERYCTLFNKGKEMA